MPTTQRALTCFSSSQRACDWPAIGSPELSAVRRCRLMPILMEKVCWGLGEDAARLLRIGCWALAAGCCGLRVAGCVRTCFVREMQDATGTGTGTGTVTLAGLGLDIPPSSFPLLLAEGGWGRLPIGCGRLRPAAQTATCGVPTAAALGHRPGSEIAANRAASEMTSTFRHETGSSASCRPLTCGERECTSPTADCVPAEFPE